MKLLIFFFLIFFVSTSFAELTCSSNGTNVYYVNGVLTSELANADDKDKIKQLFLDKDLDEKGEIHFMGIHNPSFGFMNDAAELFAQAYYLKNGTKSGGKAFFNLVNESKINVNELNQANKGIYSTGVSFFNFPKAMSIASLILAVDESIASAREKASLDSDTFLKENNKIINSVGDKIYKARKENKKIIFVSHSQGNAVVEAGIKKITSDFSYLNEELEKYMGVMHVASPVPPISSLPEFSSFKQRNIRLDKDLIIGALSSIPGYPLDTAPITHKVVSRNIFKDVTGHFLSDSYLSDNIASLVSNPSIEDTTKNIFKNNMIILAEELEDNCFGPNIVIETTDGVFDEDDSSNLIIPGYAGQNRMINLKASNSNEKTGDKDTTKFEWHYRKFIPENYYTLQENLPFFEDFISMPTSTDLNAFESINFPFNNINFMVSVTATDKNGKTSRRGIFFKTLSNYAPTITLESNQCTVQNDGFTYVDSSFVYKINDDSIANRGKFQRKVVNEFFDMFFPVVNFTDSLGVQAVTLEVPNPCPNRFSIGSPYFFCDGSRPSIAINVTSVAGAIVSFGGGAASYVRNVRPGGTAESVYRYPGNPLDGEEHSIKVSVGDYWTNELHDAGDVNIRHCP